MKEIKLDWRAASAQPRGAGSEVKTQAHHDLTPAVQDSQTRVKSGIAHGGVTQ
jgi:hypothetical protein